MQTAAQARYVDCRSDLGFEEHEVCRLLHGVGRPAWAAVIMKADVQAIKVNRFRTIE